MVINPIVGVYIPIIYNIYIYMDIRIPIKGGMTIRNIATFDHGASNLRNAPKLSEFLAAFCVPNFIPLAFFSNNRTNKSNQIII